MKINWIEIDNVKSFKSKVKVQLNSDHNFVVGTNGSGKTTLLQVLSSCLLVLVPLRRTKSESRGNEKWLTFETPPHNVILPRNFERQGDNQTIRLEISFESSKDGLISELEKYQAAFSDNKEYLRSKFLDLEGLLSEFDSYLAALKGYSSYVYTFDFYVDSNSGIVSLTGESRQNNKGILDILDNLEIFRQIYDHLFKAGKATEVVTRGFQIIYLNADRLIGFPAEVPQVRGNLDEYFINSSYGQRANLTGNIYSNSSFNYIDQTLTSIAEEHFHRKWDLQDAEPLENIKQYTDLKARIKDILGLDFGLEISPLINEPIKPYFLCDGNKIYFDQFSSGEKSLIYLLFTLANSDIQNSFILIDEAEIHLHGNMQDKLLSILYEFKELNNQHFITTHSPKLINKLTISSVLRFYKTEGSTQHINFRNDTNQRTDYDIIRLINSQNNEKIFFADKVVLVEGIKDRILIEAIINQVNDTKEIIEVIDVGGKLNLSFYRDYLEEIKVSNYTLSDFDYLYDICKKELGSLFVTSNSKIDAIIKHKKSEDRKTLIDAMEGFVSSNDKTTLNKVTDYLKTRGIVLKDNLKKEEKVLLTNTIDKLRSNNIYIISAGLLSDKSKYSGEIEDYLQYIQTSKNRDDSISNLVKYISKDNFVNAMVKKLETNVAEELLGFIAAVVYNDVSRGSDLIR